MRKFLLFILSAFLILILIDNILIWGEFFHKLLFNYRNLRRCLRHDLRVLSLTKDETLIVSGRTFLLLVWLRNIKRQLKLLAFLQNKVLAILDLFLEFSWFQIRQLQPVSITFVVLIIKTFELSGLVNSLLLCQFHERLPCFFDLALVLFLGGDSLSLSFTLLLLLFIFRQFILISRMNYHSIIVEHDRLRSFLNKCALGNRFILWIRAFLTRFLRRRFHSSSDFYIIFFILVWLLGLIIRIARWQRERFKRIDVTFLRMSRLVHLIKSVFVIWDLTPHLVYFLLYLFLRTIGGLFWGFV